MTRKREAGPLIDLTFYIKGVGDNPELLKKSLGNVEKSWIHYVEEIERAMDSKDPESLHYWAHTLKGSLAFIKAEDGVAIAKEICEEAKKGGVEKTKKPLIQLKEYLDLLRKNLEEFISKIKT